MSFILDALKKSESDRQRHSGPSLFEVKVAPPRRTLPVWAVVVAALLLINVIVISWMLLRHPAAQQSAPPASAPPSAAAAGAPSEPTANGPPLPATRHAQQTARAPSQNQPPAAAGLAAAPPATSPAPPPAVPPAAAPAAAPVTGSTEQSPGQATPGGASGQPSDTAPAVEPAASAPGGAGDLPLYRQIVSSAGLPDLHLDLHVFATRPQDRFVMVNMHRLGEGDSLPNGVQVQAIRPDGVVLSYRGTRFLLPRN